MGIAKRRPDVKRRNDSRALPAILGGVEEFVGHPRSCPARVGAAGDPGPQAHVEKVDPIGFVVRRLIQCSRGKS